MEPPTVPAGFRHEPVLVGEIVELFATVPAGILLDATLGGAGHARALLRSRAELTVLGVDRDPAALDAARQLPEARTGRLQVRRARFDALAEVVAELAVDVTAAVTGALFDLGVSSPQLDRPERGFSYRHDARLDMRMDPDQELSAHEVVNTYPADQLARVLAAYGDERFARRIARAVVAARPIETTGELAAIVREAIPAATRRRGGHPAKRTFQALRIEVNDELAVLPTALSRAIDLLSPGGRLAVISYHSGEDRVAKQVLRRAATGGCTCPPGLPCVCGAQPLVRPVWRGGRTPGAEELARNPRAASARLRAVEKLSTPGSRP